MNTDYLFANDFEVPCRVGTTAEERAFPQILHISLRVEFSLEKAGKTDDLKNSVDYAVIIEDVRNSLSRREFNLIETVAESIAEICLNNDLAHATEVIVEKNIFVGIKSVGAFIRREKKLGK